MQVVSELRALTDEAAGHVAAYTGLHPQLEVPPVRVVDRKDWSAINIHGLKQVLIPLVTRLSGDRQPGGLADAIGSRVTGVQAGTILAYLSGRVLGQYEVFSGNPGQLLLNAPNIVEVERKLGADPRDFRLWVCLHEVTHRVQFRANPWLADHMSQALAVLTQDAGEDVTEMVGRLAEFVRNQRNGQAPDPNSTGVLGLMRAVQAEPQRRALDQLLVLGTLLEGHADHVMDAVGPAVVPTVSTIRRRFDERRQRKQPPLQRLVRALLGFDAKISQYTRGKAFVDHVVTTVGMARFNTIWSNPDTLPLPDEIDEPQRWIDRVL
jgi:coenzyme F420 biosynthesis associated uncharacterized protein